MERIIALVIVLAIAVYAMPVFAGQGSKYKAPCKEKSLFQMMYDSINKPVVKSAKPMQPDKVTIFQELSNSIKEGSEKARQTSLRGTK